MTSSFDPPWALKGLFWLALICFVKAAQALLAPVAVAVVLAFLLVPGVRALRRRGVPVPAGAALMLGALVAVVAALVVLLAQPATKWWERAPSLLAQLLSQVDRMRAAIPLAAPSASVERSPPTPHGNASGSSLPADRAAAKSGSIDSMRAQLASDGMALTGTLLGKATSFAASAAATLILLFLLLTSEGWMLARVVEAFPARRTRALVLAGMRSAQRDIGRFLGNLGLVYALAGALTSVAVAWIGLPNPLLWGVLTMMLNFIPYIGPTLVVAMLFLASLASFDPGRIVFASPAAFLLIHMVEANFVSPWFVAQRLLLSPVAVFLSVLFWAWMWGFTGAFIAVPLLVGLRGICKRQPSLTLLYRLLQGASGQPPSLQSLLRPRKPALPLGAARQASHGTGATGAPTEPGRSRSR